MTTNSQQFFTSPSRILNSLPTDLERTFTTRNSQTMRKYVTIPVGTNNIYQNHAIQQSRVLIAFFTNHKTHYQPHKTATCLT